MKLQSLIATALVLAKGSALLAQNPAEKTKPATTEKATPPRLCPNGCPKTYAPYAQSKLLSTWIVPMRKGC